MLIMLRLCRDRLAATVNQTSNGIAVSATIFRPSVVKSNIAIILTIEVVFTKDTASACEWWIILLNICEMNTIDNLLRNLR